MNNEFVIWLDAATTGLPTEIHTAVRGELAHHYHDALADYQQSGKTAAEAHEQVMDELGEAADTAHDLRRTHLAPRRHLAAFITLLIVVCGFIINNGSLTPNAYTSGTTRIVASAFLFILHIGALLLLRNFLTRQLRLTSLKTPLNLQMLGWGLTVLPFLREVLLAKITPLNELLMTDYPLYQYRFYQVSEFVSIAASLFLTVGLLLMAWRLKQANAHLYGFGRVLRWVTFSNGLIFAYSSITQLMNVVGVNFMVSSGPDTLTRIGLIARGQPMENVLWLSSGVNWLDALSQFFTVAQVALLGLMALLFFRAYLHNRYWLNQPVSP